VGVLDGVEAEFTAEVVGGNTMVVVPEMGRRLLVFLDCSNGSRTLSRFLGVLISVSLALIGALASLRGGGGPRRVARRE
jgi:hypothetical protein